MRGGVVAEARGCAGDQAELAAGQVERRADRGLVGQQRGGRPGEQVAVTSGANAGSSAEHGRVKEHPGVQRAGAGADRRPAGQQRSRSLARVQAEQVDRHVGEAGAGQQQQEAAVELLQGGGGGVSGEAEQRGDQVVGLLDAQAQLVPQPDEPRQPHQVDVLQRAAVQVLQPHLGRVAGPAGHIDDDEVFQGGVVGGDPAGCTPTVRRRPWSSELPAGNCAVNSAAVSVPLFRASSVENGTASASRGAISPLAGLMKRVFRMLTTSL